MLKGGGVILGFYSNYVRVRVSCCLHLDFKSESNIPYSQGSFTFDDNPQCTLAYNLKEDELTVSATGILNSDAIVVFFFFSRGPHTKQKKMV